MAELTEILGKIVAGALVIGDPTKPSVQRSVLDLLEAEIVALRDEAQ